MLPASRLPIFLAAPVNSSVGGSVGDGVTGISVASGTSGGVGAGGSEEGLQARSAGLEFADDEKNGHGSKTDTYGVLCSAGGSGGGGVGAGGATTSYVGIRVVSVIKGGGTP
jgi:hypothetical protein